MIACVVQSQGAVVSFDILAKFRDNEAWTFRVVPIGDLRNLDNFDIAYWQFSFIMRVGDPSGTWETEMEQHEPDEARRNFLKLAAKTAVYTPPSIMALAAPSAAALGRSARPTTPKSNPGLGNDGDPLPPPPNLQQNEPDRPSNDDDSFSGNRSYRPRYRHKEGPCSTPASMGRRGSETSGPVGCIDG